MNVDRATNLNQSKQQGRGEKNACQHVYVKP